ncbi:MAG TPA: sigma-70 family RNA polymerase sigma factor [Candidatus Scybalousia intestinigallinarum]|nr:sigma-70 family RNA polymerase sigma factor [Candidatus Scybalousia intestinigallinarum]
MAIDLQEYEGRILAYASKFRYYYDMDDLIQVGRIGLLNALDHYDPSQNTKFSSYAFLYIKGEILKYVRENKNIKISKELSSLVKPIERAKEVLRQRLQKEPTIEEVSHFLEIDRSVIEEVIMSQEFVRSLDYVLNEDDEGKEMNLYHTLAYEEAGYDANVLDLKQAVADLEEEEKKLITCRYFEDMTQSETSKILGVNQVKVSREETKILKKLRGVLTDS